MSLGMVCLWKSRLTYSLTSGGSSLAKQGTNNWCGSSNFLPQTTGPYTYAPLLLFRSAEDSLVVKDSDSQCGIKVSNISSDGAGGMCHSAGFCVCLSDNKYQTKTCVALSTLDHCEICHQFQKRTTWYTFFFYFLFLRVNTILKNILMKIVFSGNCCLSGSCLYRQFWLNTFKAVEPAVTSKTHSRKSPFIQEGALQVSLESNLIKFYLILTQKRFKNQVIASSIMSNVYLLG